MLTDRSQIREGMTVLSSDGEKLGKVQSCEATTFTIEKGFFFPKDYVARYEEIESASGDELRLATTKDAFERMRESGSPAEASQPAGATGNDLWSGGTAGTTGVMGPSGASAERTDTGAMDRPAARAASREDEVRVPIAEEQVDVVKRDREAGEVRLRKDVITETKHLDVPVTREEVRVERVPAQDRAATPGEATFQERSVSMPVREEEVEIRKRPVVKEEVRLRKERVTEQRAADAEIRKEQVEIEGEGPGVREPGTGAPRRDDEP